MSTALITSATMDRIVDAIREHCSVFHNIVPDTTARLAKIGAALFAANFVAINITTGETVALPRYQFIAPLYPNEKADAILQTARLAQQYRACDALLVVCAGEELRNQPPIEALSRLRYRLALVLADDHPAVNTSPATWDDATRAHGTA